MTLRHVLVVYVIVGLACAAVILRRDPLATGRTLASAALALPLWPLWAPFAFASDPRASPDDEGSLGRIRVALAEATDAVRGTSLETAFTSGDAAAILADAEAIAARGAATRRVHAEVERASAPAHRLAAMIERDEQRLAELAAALASLRTELLVARAVAERGDDQDGRATLARVSALLTALRDGSDRDAGPST
jgi:hypothetical protein